MAPFFTYTYVHQHDNSCNILICCICMTRVYIDSQCVKNNKNPITSSMMTTTTRLQIDAQSIYICLSFPNGIFVLLAQIFHFLSPEREKRKFIVYDVMPATVVHTDTKQLAKICKCVRYLFIFLRVVVQCDSLNVG